MTERTPPFSLQQIGTGAVRFPSGAPIPSVSDLAVDPYSRSRQPKGHQVEALQFWPQEKGTYPGIILLHEWWGLTAQIKDLGARLACEGYAVIIPNLYGRIGGMVTASDEVAAALMERVKEADLVQDINSCCEFLNTQDYVKRNTYAVMGFGMGGSLAIRFGCHRKRLRAVVAFYGKMVGPAELLKDLQCPLLYHQAGRDEWATQEDVDRLLSAAKEYGKRVEVRTYPDAPHAFCNDARKDYYRADAAREAWNSSIDFLKSCFQGA